MPQILNQTQVDSILNLTDAVLDFAQEVSESNKQSMDLVVGLLGRLASLWKPSCNPRIDDTYMHEQLLPLIDGILENVTSISLMGTYDNDLPTTFQNEQILITSQRITAKTLKSLQLKTSNGSMDYSVSFPASINLPSNLPNSSSMEGDYLSKQISSYNSFHAVYYDVRLKAKDFNPFTDENVSLKSVILEASVNRNSKISDFLLEETDPSLPPVSSCL